MILQKEIETSKAIILVIGGLPEDIKNCTFGICRLYTYATDEITHVEPNNSYEIPDGSYQSLGFLKDITEDVAKKLVQTYFLDFNLWGFKDYTRTDASICYINATDSLRSLIEANCKLKNEYGNVRPELNPECCNKIVYDRNGYPECCGMPVPSEESVCLQQRWDKEQETVFTNLFLLKKI